jgi:transglutaminase-like putative cysteine protease
VRLPAEETREATAAAPASAEYPIPHRHRFSLPGVSPGAILRVHYRSEWRRFPLPHLFVEAPLAHDVPMLESRIDVRVGADTTLHHHVLGAAAREPAVEETPSGRVYTWTFSGVPAVADEALAPPDRVPRLLLSTFPDWGAFASWYRRLIQLADVVTPEIEAKAAELVRGKSSEREKVIALYEYVTSLRYVAVPLGVNSHRPHAAENVLRNRYGDCKDKANLFNTLLKTQGIPAHLVLVPRFGEANPAVPGLGFNHAISRVRVGGEWTFADTTDTDARFGLLPPGDPGRQVLVVDGQSTGLVTLPSPIPADHRLSLDVDVPASAEASSTLAVRALGFADYALRQVARAASGPGATRPVFAEAFRATAGSVGLQTQAHTAASALDREFEWRGEGRWVGLHFDLGGGHRGVFAPFWLPREWEAARHARRSGLFVNSGYPLVLDERVALALPSGAGAAVLPPARKNERAPLRYDLTWTAAAADRLEARLRVELTSGEIAAGDVGLFQDQLRDLLAAAAQAATYRVGP